MNLWLTNFSIRFPKLILLLTLIVTVLFGAQFPKVTFDNDPENMLPADEPIRVFHQEVKEKYALYDFVIVGIVNDKDPAGVFNPATLGRIDHLTKELLSLQKGADGLPQVGTFDEDGKRAGERSIDLSPDGAWQRALNVAFNHAPNRLFDEEGQSIIIGRELISPSVVDNIKQADLGSLKLEYLMEQAPKTASEAKVIRDDAMNNPLYAGTLVSEDEKAICLYIPIQKKIYSYNVASLVQNLTADWPQADQVFITGQPVAQDTFGIEMLVQMATSAPMAGLMIFLLLLFFFRNLSLIIAPMIVAIVSVITTMGLLIGLGFDVHIMSSMIAIFLMPIAVADSVHILSEFYDTYPRFKDKAETVRYVIGHLFRPMLYTTLTTIAGFASLGTTPIPPVQVFGLHVAFGVGMAWLLSMTLIPAYILLLVPEKQLEKLELSTGEEAPKSGLLTRFLQGLGAFSTLRYRVILIFTMVAVVVALVGISRIKVNDNPVKWFSPEHDIRVADRVLNSHFGGTYTAYLTLASTQPGLCDCEENSAEMAKEVEKRFGAEYPEEVALFKAKLQELRDRYGKVSSRDVARAFVELVQLAEELDSGSTAVWADLADEINYLDPEGLTVEVLHNWISPQEKLPKRFKQRVHQEIHTQTHLTGEALIDAALAVTDRYTANSFVDFVYEMQAELTAPLFKRPEMLRYLERLQQHLTNNQVVGKTSSAVDSLKKASYELNYLEPPGGLGQAEMDAYHERNQSHNSIPDSAAAIGQVFVQLEGMKKKDSLFHLITRDYQEANVWVQLTSGDNQDMVSVVDDLEKYLEANEPPTPLKIEWAGLTYLNVVWQERMVNGMMTSLVSSFVVVLVMMVMLFRSPLFGLLAMIPLTITIMVSYGIIGLVGKDYDMPVAVLSALTLGLSVDFAIHFLQRSRELQEQTGDWFAAAKMMFMEPAMAISRNAIIIAVGFTPLLLAPLVPYQTVGFFLATIMAVSWLATLFILPALLTPLQKLAFRKKED
ncbi:MMPL family protein [Malonomonas rubra DSM 5091]|uniref:MMPL family protein n=1 Tax=Malonomonas rubra DSM 5091 TaxID=1122189 RepID=A0A1M6INR0_MALRU|nr:MMPL family transporter [Malonomonas rubra]SHJ36096.1 MMPL family protein [Malonomonas rubra DSM 5091]